MPIDHSYLAWCLKTRTGRLCRDVFETKRDLINHYTWGGGPASKEWKGMKKKGYKPSRVIVREI